MADEINLELEIPVINFDVIQGQDLDLPIEYTTQGVPDTLEGASLRMDVRTPNYSTLIDTLNTTNNRIVITAPNKFVIKFPNSVSSAYTMTGAKLILIYGLELVSSSGRVKRIFEGTITVKREQTTNV